MSAANLIVSVTFDGFGMNDATDTYRRRVATFAPIINDDERKKYAALWVKAPALKSALTDLLICHDHGNGAEQWDRIKQRARDVLAELEP